MDTGLWFGTSSGVSVSAGLASPELASSSSFVFFRSKYTRFIGNLRSLLLRSSTLAKRRSSWSLLVVGLFWSVCWKQTAVPRNGSNMPWNSRLPIWSTGFGVSISCWVKRFDQLQTFQLKSKPFKNQIKTRWLPKSLPDPSLFLTVCCQLNHSIRPRNLSLPAPPLSQPFSRPFSVNQMMQQTNWVTSSGPKSIVFIENYYREIEKGMSLFLKFTAWSSYCSNMFSVDRSLMARKMSPPEVVRFVKLFNFWKPLL